MPPGAEKLLLLGGPGAPEHVGELLLLLAYEPDRRHANCAPPCGSASAAGTWCSNNGVEIWLPEEDAVAALEQLAKLDDTAQIARRASSASSICDCRTSSISGNADRAMRRPDRREMLGEPVV